MPRLKSKWRSMFKSGHQRAVASAEVSFRLYILYSDRYAIVAVFYYILACSPFVFYLIVAFNPPTIN